MSFIGEVPCGAEGLASWDDSDFHERVCVFEHPACCGVSGFMEGYDFLFRFCYHFVFLFETAYYSVDGVEEVLFRDSVAVASCCYEGGLVAYVSNVGTGESGCLFGEEVLVNVGCEFQVAHVDVEDLVSSIKVREFHINLSVKAAGAHECLVKDVGAVCCGENDDA